jgi:hypothetical protein
LAKFLVNIFNKDSLILQHNALCKIICNPWAAPPLPWLIGEGKGALCRRALGPGARHYWGLQRLLRRPRGMRRGPRELGRFHRRHRNTGLHIQADFKILQKCYILKELLLTFASAKSKFIEKSSAT